MFEVPRAHAAAYSLNHDVEYSQPLGHIVTITFSPSESSPQTSWSKIGRPRGTSPLVLFSTHPPQDSIRSNQASTVDMDNHTEIQKPAPALQTESSQSSDRPLKPTQTPTLQGQDGDYDPCQNAQKFSPFYMYNHDSPRPSADLRPKQSIHVSVQDLELGDISPSVTQEKLQAQSNSRLDRLKVWGKQKKQQCLTKPKQQRWLQRLPKKQRVAVKLLIAFLVAGVMVGVAVGIAAALHSGVYGSDKIVGEHQN